MIKRRSPSSFDQFAIYNWERDRDPKKHFSSERTEFWWQSLKTDASLSSTTGFWLLTIISFKTCVMTFLKFYFFQKKIISHQSQNSKCMCRRHKFLIKINPKITSRNCKTISCHQNAIKRHGRANPPTIGINVGNLHIQTSTERASTYYCAYGIQMHRSPCCKKSGSPSCDDWFFY